MRPVLRRAIRVAVLLLFSIYGCTAATFSSLQSDFVRLYQQKDKCEKSLKRNEPLPFECMADYDQALLDIAREAEKSVEREDDPRTRIGILRLGALAAWQAGEKGFDTANDLASKGSRLCESLDKKRFGAPRDCAILSMIPALIAQDRWVAQFKELGTKNPEDKRAFFESFSKNYKWNTWDAVSEQALLLTKDPGVDQSVLLYVERQKNYFYCTAVKVQKALQEFLNNFDDSRALEKEFDNIVKQRDEMERSLGQDGISCQDLE